MNYHASCLLLAFLFACMPIPADARQVKLKATLQVAASEPYLGVPLIRFKEEVEKRSKGVISVEIFDNGQLYSDTEVVEAVASGAIDLGVAGSYEFSKTIPDISLVEQPFLLNFEALVRAALDADSDLRWLIDQSIVRATGARVLWWQPAGASVFFSNGSDVADPGAIKRKRVRVFSTITAILAEECAGTPTVISAANLHEALRDRNIDVAMDSVASVEPRELWKVSDTITLTNHVPIEFLLLINDRVWWSMTTLQRAYIADAARDVEKQTRERVAKLDAAALAFARGKGMRVRPLTSNEFADWRACSADLLSEFVTHSGDLGRRLLAAYGRLRTLACCSEPPSRETFGRR
jgi:TRAP-type C4-dicarboxylate transport system substrate-binding protein